MSVRECLARGLAVLASLKLTVGLLATAIGLVFAGTLAQRFGGIWTIVDKYFRCWVAWVDFKDIMPAAWDVSGTLPYPGGWLIGGALVVNLLVSHASRIRLQARGQRLALGIATLLVGSVLTWLVISTVFDADSSQKKIAPFWRVTLQLLQGGGVAAILFFGCRMLFGRKAGIVLLHGGLILMMATEIIAGLLAEEGQMTIAEGQSSDFVHDIRRTELAVIDPSHPGHDTVVVVPEDMLKGGEKISAPELPFDLQARRFLKNADLNPIMARDENPATAGTGLQLIAVKRAEESGVSTDSRADYSAAYVTFMERGTGASLGTYLTAVETALNETPERVTVGGKVYHVALRFKRTYKPYELFLNDFRFERYPGTDKPKDFSSYVRLIDRERATDRDVRIWMNNPMRYRGDTIYQSSFDSVTEQTTVLQVVTNSGWMVPYVACMIVAAGLMGQFLMHLLEFLRKRRAAA